jgi:hypothetical protein
LKIISNNREQGFQQSGAHSALVKHLSYRIVLLLDVLSPGQHISAPNSLQNDVICDPARFLDQQFGFMQTAFRQNYAICLKR